MSNMGPGKYDKQLTEALKSSGAKQGLLIVIDGKDGPSFCAQMTKELTKEIPQLLRHLAKNIEKTELG